MAKYELKFLDCVDKNAFIKVDVFEPKAGNMEKEVICISGSGDDGNGDSENEFCLWLDKSTAIKFAKTLRTEINKIQS